MQQKEKTILLIYRWLMIALGIFHIATAVVNFSQKTYFYAVMALGGLLLGPVLILFWRILRFPIVIMHCFATPPAPLTFL